MKSARVWVCVLVLAAGTVLCLGTVKRVRSPSPQKLDFTAARSTEDDADIEIKEVALVAAGGARSRPSTYGPDGLACYVRAGGQEQRVASLQYG